MGFFLKKKLISKKEKKMVVCDKCKKALEKHHVVQFGYVGTVWEKNQNWDLCQECEKEVLNKIKEIIK